MEIVHCKSLHDEPEPTPALYGPEDQNHFRIRRREARRIARQTPAERRAAAEYLLRGYIDAIWYELDAAAEVVSEDLEAYDHDLADPFTTVSFEEHLGNAARDLKRAVWLARRYGLAVRSVVKEVMRFRPIPVVGYIEDGKVHYHDPDRQERWLAGQPA